MKSIRWGQWIYAALILLLVGLRLGLAVHAARHIERFTPPDTIAYETLARSLLETGQYTDPNDPHAELFRPPAYPMFLVLVLLVGRGELAPAPILQAVLALLTALLVYLTACQAGSRSAGKLGAFLFLANPNALYWSLIVMAETLSAFFLVLSAYLLNRQWRSGGLRWGLLAGGALGLAALTRPIMYPLLLIWGGLLLFMAIRKSTLRITEPQPAKPQPHSVYVRAASLFVAGTLAVTLPWQARNYFVNHQFTLSTTAGYTLEYWNAARVLARAQDMSIPEAQRVIAAASDPTAAAWQIVRQYPRLAALEQLRGLLRTLLGAEYATWGWAISGQALPTAGLLSQLFEGPSGAGLASTLATLASQPWAWAGLYALGYDLLLLALILAGAIRVFRLRQLTSPLNLWLLVAVAAAYLILSPLANGDSRFRAPADPLLALLGGLAFFETED